MGKNIDGILTGTQIRQSKQMAFPGLEIQSKGTSVIIDDEIFSADKRAMGKTFYSKVTVGELNDRLVRRNKIKRYVTGSNETTEETVINSTVTSKSPATTSNNDDEQTELFNEDKAVVQERDSGLFEIPPKAISGLTIVLTTIQSGAKYTYLSVGKFTSYTSRRLKKALVSLKSTKLKKIPFSQVGNDKSFSSNFSISHNSIAYKVNIVLVLAVVVLAALLLVK